jgi:hypothetical protein
MDFKRGKVIAHRSNLFKVNRKEGADGPGCLVLMDVAQLMRDQPIANIVMADKDGMPERDAGSIRSEQSGFGDQLQGVLADPAAVTDSRL